MAGKIEKLAEHRRARASTVAKPADRAADGSLEVTGRRCPLCRKPATVHYRPFCSKRCADIDLGRWLSEDYRVSAEVAEMAENNGESEDG